MSVPRWIVPAILSALCLALVLACAAPMTHSKKCARQPAAPMILPLCSRWALSGTGAEHVHTGQNSWYRTILTWDGTGSLVSRLDFPRCRESVLCVMWRAARMILPRAQPIFPVTEGFSGRRHRIQYRVRTR